MVRLNTVPKRNYPLSVQPSLDDIRLQIPTFRPARIKYPLTYKGGTSIRFPLLYYLAENVVVEDMTEVSREQDFIYTRNTRRLATTPRKTQDSIVQLLNRTATNTQIADSITLKLSADRGVTTTDLKTLQSTGRTVEKLFQYFLAKESRLAETSMDVRMAGGESLIDMESTTVTTSTSYQTSSVLDPTLRLGLSAHIITEMESMQLYRQVLGIDKIVDKQLFKQAHDIFKHTELQLEKIFIRLGEMAQTQLTPPQQFVDILDEKLISNFNRSMTEHSSVAMLKPTDSYNSICFDTFRPVLQQAGSSALWQAVESVFTSRVQNETNLNIATGDAIGLFSEGRRNYFLDSTLGVIKTPAHISVTEGLAEIKPMPDMIDFIDSLCEITKAPKSSSVQSNEGFIVKAPKLILVSDAAANMFRTTKNFDVDTSTHRLTNIASALFNIRNTQALHAGTGNLNTDSMTSFLDAGRNIASVVESVITSVSSENTISDMNPLITMEQGKKGLTTALEHFLDNYGQQASIDDSSVIISKAGQELRLNDDTATLLSIGGNQVAIYDCLTALNKDGKMIGAFDSMAEIIKDPTFGVTPQSEEHFGKLSSRLWFIRNDNEPKDSLILPSDYDYPVKLEFLQVQPEDYSQFNWQMKIPIFNAPLQIRVYDKDYNQLSNLIMPNNLTNWKWYGRTEQDVRIIVQTNGGVTDVELILYDPSAMYITIHHPLDDSGFKSWYAVVEQFIMQKHPIPIGDDLGLKELPIPIEILIEIVNILLLMWARFYMAFTGQTGTQALNGMCLTVHEWLTLTSSLEKMGDNAKYYFRCYRWIRWETEKLMQLSKQDPELSGNMWVERLIGELIDYMEQHHFDYMPRFKDLEKMDEHRAIFESPDDNIPFILDKYKGIRNRRI